MDTSEADQRLPHVTDPPRFLSVDELKVKTGIEYFKVQVQTTYSRVTIVSRGW